MALVSAADKIEGCAERSEVKIVLGNELKIRFLTVL